MAGRDVLLNYVMTVRAIEPIQPASRTYLHNALVIAPLKTGAVAGIYECTTKAEIQEHTDANIGAILDAGMIKVYVCAVAEYADAQALIDNTSYKFFTILVDKVFDSIPEKIDGFSGVVGWDTKTRQDAKEFEFRATEDNTGFVDGVDNTGANMYYSFGKLLSGVRWRNQQYAAMPETGITNDLGVAKSLFDDRVSFVLNSEEFGNRLALFTNRGRAIVAPYIYEEFKLDLQSWALQYINTNQPDYNDVEAAKLQAYLTKKASEKYINGGMVPTLRINIMADQDNFVMSGFIAIAEPKATWRIDAEIQQGGDL